MILTIPQREYMTKRLVSSLNPKSGSNKRALTQIEKSNQSIVARCAAILEMQICTQAACNVSSSSSSSSTHAVDTTATETDFRKAVHSILNSVIASLKIEHRKGSNPLAAILSDTLTVTDMMAGHAKSVIDNLAVFDAITDHHRTLAAQVLTASSSWESAIASDDAASGLEKYANAAVSMGNKVWVRHGQEWMEELTLQFFFGSGAEDAYVKRQKGLWFAEQGSTMPDHVQLALRASLGQLLPCPVTGADRVALLDVGSCYNPHGGQEKFAVTALDLEPTHHSVYQCDFLTLEVLEKNCPARTSARRSTSGPARLLSQQPASEVSTASSPPPSALTLTALPRNTYHALTLSLVLNYLPSSTQRIAMLRKARELLVCPADTCVPTLPASSGTENRVNPHMAGLLLIMEKESVLAAGPRRGPILLRSWKQSISALGFELVTYQFQCTEGRKSHLFAFKAIPLVIPSHDLPLYCKADLDALSEEDFDTTMSVFNTPQAVIQGTKRTVPPQSLSAPLSSTSSTEKVDTRATEKRTRR